LRLVLDHDRPGRSRPRTWSRAENIALPEHHGGQPDPVVLWRAGGPCNALVLPVNNSFLVGIDAVLVLLASRRDIVEKGANQP
jgi:hypothetical protein